MRAMIVSFLVVGLGGALGAMARLAISVLLQHSIVIVPLGTFASNMLGCFVMGVVVWLLAQTDWALHASFVTEQNRLFFAVGFCGSFTTLSSMVVEMNTLLQRSEIFHAFAYMSASVIGGFACFYAGIALVRLLLQAQGS